MTDLLTKKEGASTTSKENKNDLNIYKYLFNDNTPIPEHVDKKHWEEWLSSGVKPSIIAQNVFSIHDSWEVDKLLNRNNKSRSKHSDNLIPCWAVRGIDPQTDEITSLGCQVKPDTQILNKAGKLQKYIGASGYETAPLFLKTEVHGFWLTLIQDKSKPIIVTEGAKKAGAGLSIGYATISIPGVSTCRKSGRLHDSLKLFTGFGRTFYLCFDNDVVYKKHVKDAMLGLAREISAMGSKIMVIELPEGEFKGMDDYINHHGKEEFDKLFINAVTIEEWRKKLEEQWQKQQQEEGEENRSKLKKYFEIVRDGWGEGLALNQLKSCIELGGKPLDINQIRLHIALEFGCDVPIGDSQMIVELLANQNAYNPVVNYLDQLGKDYPNIDTSILDNLATRYFGSENELHNIYMKKSLIAAVARARQPGCKHDCATILVGKQGAFKSTFWKTLYGADWFTDELGEANEKDELMKLHRFWCLEWSEFETVYRRKDVSALKKFMSSTVDAFRTPYSRTIKEYPRSCVLVGTTNETEILADPTGNRRFWVIPITQQISLDLVREERDKLWAAANALYMAGEQWWLSGDEGEMQEIYNREYQLKDPWENEVKVYLQSRDYVTTEEVLKHLGVELGRQDIACAKRLSAIMKRLEWEQARKRINNEPLWIWREKKEKKLDFFHGSHGSHGSADSFTDPLLSHNNDVLASVHEVNSSTLDINQSDFTDQVNNVNTNASATNEGGDPCDPCKIPKLFSSPNNNGDMPLVPEVTDFQGEVIKLLEYSPLGKIKCIANQYEEFGWELLLLNFDESIITKTSVHCTNPKIAHKKLKKYFHVWLDGLKFMVYDGSAKNPNWIEGCIITKLPNYALAEKEIEFTTPDGKVLREGRKDYYQLESSVMR